MRSFLSILLCLVTALASTPGSVMGVESSTVNGSCACHKACCCAPASDQPVKPVPAAPSSKLSAQAWKYQADDGALLIEAAAEPANDSGLPTSDAVLLERLHEVPLFVRHCCPLL